MKKGIFLLIAIIVTVFVLHGCHSNQAATKKAASAGTGYPVGHDMHPNAKSDEGHPATDGYS